MSTARCRAQSPVNPTRQQSGFSLTWVTIVFSVSYLNLTRSFDQWPLPPGEIQERPRHVTHTRVIDIGTFNANPHKKNMYMRTAALARGVAYTVQEEIYALLKVTPNVRPAYSLRALISHVVLPAHCTHLSGLVDIRRPRQDRYQRCASYGTQLLSRDGCMGASPCRSFRCYSARSR